LTGSARRFQSPSRDVEISRASGGSLSCRSEITLRTRRSKFSRSFASVAPPRPAWNARNRSSRSSTSFLSDSLVNTPIALVARSRFSRELRSTIAARSCSEDGGTALCFDPGGSGAWVKPAPAASAETAGRLGLGRFSRFRLVRRCRRLFCYLRQASSRRTQSWLSFLWTRMPIMIHGWPHSRGVDRGALCGATLRHHVQ
jgi:hypothetical protein